MVDIALGGRAPPGKVEFLHVLRSILVHFESTLLILMWAMSFVQ